MNEQDDWQPDFTGQTILKKTVVRFTNKRVEENLKKFNSQPDVFKDDNESDEERDDEQENMMFEKSGLHSKQTGETLYDPLKDDRCESWTNTNLTSGKYCKPLSCPGCFTPVCYSYEEHPQHEGQYYSPTIRNCEVNYSKMIEAQPAPATLPSLQPDVLSHLEESQLSDIEKSLQQQQSSYNVYFPVHCGECNHQLAMYDVDRKTYHLYSVV